MSRETGIHRTHMRSGKGDWITAYLPLAKDGRVDKKAPQPFLMKALWDGDIFYGELTPENGKHHRIVWDSGPDAFTDLGTVPVEIGRLVRISNSDEAGSEWREFVVQQVVRV